MDDQAVTDTLPSVGPDGAVSYPGPRNAGTTSQTVDGIVKSSRALQALVRDVDSVGSELHVTLEQTPEHAAPQPGSHSSGVAAQYRPSAPGVPAHVAWLSGAVDYAVDYDGQEAKQILFHEYDHAWYDRHVRHDADVLATLAPTMSATLTDKGGHSSTFTWTLYTLDPHGKPSLAPGFDAYQHMLIHDDLVNAYGTDRTAALREALQGANNPPGADLENSLQRYGDVRPTFPVPTTKAERARPVAPPGIAVERGIAASPFPAGGTVKGNIIDLSAEHAVMETSYGTFCYSLQDFSSRANDARSFLQVLQHGYETGTSVAVRMSHGQYFASEAQMGNAQILEPRSVRSRGFSLLEVMISLAIVSIVFGVLLSVFTAGVSSFRHPEHNGTATAATAEVETDLQALAMYDISRVTSLQVGRALTVYPNGSFNSAHNPVNGAVTFTVQSVTQPDARSAVVTLTFQDPAGGTGTVAVPVRQTGADTSGCDPANNSVANCANTNGGN